MSELENNIIEDVDEIDEDVDITEEETEDDPLVKAQSKIVSLKRQLKEVQMQSKQAEAEERKSESRKKAIESGLTEEQADSFAELKSIREELDLLKFERDNASILSANDGVDVERVMKAVKSGLFNIDEAIRAVSSSNAKSHEQRAKKAAMGELEPDDEDNVVSDATRTAGTPKRTKLTQTQQRLKKQLENTMGKQYSDEEFLSAYPN